MSECVIVALPSEEHRINKISSEKIAHMTLLYLGELPEGTDTANIAEYVHHAASMFRPFYAQVERRGVLGNDNADVLFFYKQELSHVEEFRATLLQNDQIKTAYDLAYQYPSWTPHVTLGYPDAPARKPPAPSAYSPSGDLGRGDHVEFDRIAIWFGDFDGPEFRLEEERPTMAQNEEALEFLTHHGVKGMKWGIRKDRGHEGERASKRTIDKADREYDKEHAGFSGYVKINNLIADTFNSNVGVLNDKYADIDIDVAPPSVQKEYYREVEQLFDRSIAVANQRLGTNASGTKRVRANRVGEGINSGFEVIYEELKHSEEPTRFRYLPKFNDKGFVVGFSIAPEEDMAEHTDLSNFLAHYGVKGMKWGVRRDRGSSSSSSKGRANASDASSKPKKPAKRQEDLSRYSDDKLASKLSEKKGLDALSDAELSRLTKRMQLEQSYRELSAKRPRERSKAEKFLNGAKILGQSANQLTEFINSPAGKKLGELAKKKAAKK